MQSVGTPFLWVAFTCVVVVVLAFDLWLGARSDEPMSKRQAMAWTGLWVALASAFGVSIWFFAPEKIAAESTMAFFSAYLIEYSLSVDNLFVFLLLFQAFRVPQGFQHRVLFWGIFGAVVLRAVFIFAGTALVQRFTFLLYFFGGFLIFTGLKLLLSGDDDNEQDVADNTVVKLARRFIPVADHYDGHKFFTTVDGVRRATPLLLVLVSVELSDVVFAIDSIPAVFGISSDPFIIYTSNIFAILGLRSLYFLLAGALWGLRFLKPALGIVLAFVGVKMCLPLVHVAADAMGAGQAVAWLPHHVPTPVSLAVVSGMLILGVGASLLFPGQKPAEQHAAEEVKEDMRAAVEGEHHTPPGAASPDVLPPRER